jgi:Domain of unknown function (DUF4397)
MSLHLRGHRLVRPLAVLGLSATLLGAAVPAASAAFAAGAQPASHHLPHAPSSGWLRLAHLSPNTPAVDVYLYSAGNSHAMIVIKHVTYGTVSSYQSVKSGDYTVAMRAAGAPAGGKPVLSTSVDVRPGDAYTVAGMGPFSGLRLQIMKDRLSTPHGMALVRVIQASLQQHQVTVKAGRHLLAAHQAFATVSSYEAVKPGRMMVRADGSAEKAKSRVSLKAGSISTIVVLDHPGRLAIDSIEDAAGSKVEPGGAAQTGFGGTAAQPGSPLLPWAVSLAAGLLLMVGGSRLRRRYAAAHTG